MTNKPRDVNRFLDLNQFNGFVCRNLDDRRQVFFDEARAFQTEAHTMAGAAAVAMGMGWRPIS
jgi:hypothetical protein